jgi:uncharacterized damage-inducible protein DinB
LEEDFMNAEEAKMFLNFFITSIEQEMGTTKKVVQRVPDDKKLYKPDPKSMTAHELSWHIVSTEVWILEGILKGKFEMPGGGNGGENAAPATIAEIVGWYDTAMAATLPKVKAMSGEDLAKIVTFFGLQLPNVAYLSILSNHSIHHRGQLSTYLRPMGSTVPSIYGGSADEPFQMEAGA